MLLDLKERKNPFSSQSFMFDKRVVNFLVQRVGVGNILQTYGIKGFFRPPGIPPYNVNLLLTCP